MPGLIAALDSQPGVRVQRLSIHHDDWDEIPHRLTTDAGHVIRVDWFTTIARRTVSVTMRRAIAHTKLTGDGQQQHRTTGNCTEGRQ